MTRHLLRPRYANYQFLAIDDCEDPIYLVDEQFSSDFEWMLDLELNSCVDCYNAGALWHDHLLTTKLIVKDVKGDTHACGVWMDMPLPEVKK